MRLIDANALEYELGASEYDIYAKECLRDAPTIEVPRWIPVSERLPTEEDANEWDAVLAVHKRFRSECTWDWGVLRDYPEEFTHWMPIPDAPKDGE